MLYERQRDSFLLPRNSSQMSEGFLVIREVEFFACFFDGQLPLRGGA
jgi:hypothetical protein